MASSDGVKEPRSFVSHSVGFPSAALIPVAKELLRNLMCIRSSIDNFRRFREGERSFYSILNLESCMMDKASIIKDAIDYIQELHEQERRIQADLIQLEPGKLKKNAVFDLDQEIPTLSRLKKKRIDRSYDSRRSTTSSIEDLEC
ncbi:hypothetical protein ACSBR2_027117 [Camellia fascicularis]